VKHNKKRPSKCPDRPTYFLCPACGKHAYNSRKDARRGAIERMSVYRCRRLADLDGREVWHNGHLDDDIRRGHIDRDLYYGRDGVGRIRHTYGRGWTDRNAS